MSAEPGALLLDLKDEQPERAVYLLPTRIDRLPSGQYAFASEGMAGVAIVAADLTYGLVSFEQLARAKREQLFHRLSTMQRGQMPLTLNTIVVVPDASYVSRVAAYHVPLAITTYQQDDWWAECPPLAIGYHYDTLAQAILHLSSHLVREIVRRQHAGEVLPPAVYPLTQAELPFTFTITLLK